MKTLTEVLVQRGRLLERIALQRAVLSEDMQPVQAVLDKTDRGLSYVKLGVAYVKGHPGVTALAVAVLFALKGRRIFALAKRGFFVWKAWRSLRERLLYSGFGLL
jgi:hypothetical protein